MRRLQITTKVGCENACSYCPQDKFIEAYKDRSNELAMSLDSFQTCMEKVPQEVEIWFAGMCEPWANPNCTEMILYTYKKRHNVCVITSLVGMNVSDIDLLESVPFGFFKIHLPSGSNHENIQITDDYLKVLDKVSGSSINVFYHCHGKKINSEIKSILDNYGKSVQFANTYRRSGNITLNSRLNLPRRRGAIGCGRDLQNNVLLPNGDVVLCSHDYGMKHVLGNIISLSYESLFEGEEFLKVRKGQKDGSIDILCRHCEQFCYDVGGFAKICNFPYLLDKCLCNLNGIRGFGDLYLFMRRVLKKLGKPFDK